ncbi:MAG TPA: hypothetical protein VKZ59_03175 [Acidobacteriota bacterium]|nr:hypothetical protein [Acidobacteriota bacterium]
MKEKKLEPTDRERFKLPDGYSDLDPSQQFRFFLDIKFPEVKSELRIAIPATPENLPEVAWAAVRKAIDKWLKASIRYDVVAVKDSEGKLILEGSFSEVLELHRQELLEHLGFEEL